MTDAGIDEPLPDVVEQQQDVTPGGAQAGEDEFPAGAPLEADVADAAEQARVVELDDEEYR